MDSTPSCSNPSIAPTMSSTASTAPTSCRWTCSGGTPCTRPSAAPIRRKARTARSFTQSDTAAPSTRRTSSPTCRPCGCSGITNSTWLHLTPHRFTSRMVPSPPVKARRRGSCSSHAAGTPTDRSAPRVMSPEMPAAGSRMAMRMGPKRRNINGLAAVEPPGAGVEEHDALLRFDHAPCLELERGGERRPTLRRRIHPLERLELLRCGDELRVRHGDRVAAALPQRREHEAVPQRARHAQPGRDGPRLGPRRAGLGARSKRLHHRRTAGGLHAVHSRQGPTHPARGGQLSERFPHADQSGASTGGIHDHVRQGPAELLHHLQAKALLSLDADVIVYPTGGGTG